MPAAAGEQDAPKHRMKRLRSDVSAGERGDRLGGGVGLLSGQAALLDGEGDRVAGGPDGARVLHLPECVGTDEPAVVHLQATDSASDRTR